MEVINLVSKILSYHHLITTFQQQCVMTVTIMLASRRRRELLAVIFAGGVVSYVADVDVLCAIDSRFFIEVC